MSEAVIARPMRVSSRGFGRRLRDWIGNPWGKPRFLVLVTWVYIISSITPSSSPGLSVRRPTAPNASARRTKSGSDSM